MIKCLVEEVNFTDEWELGVHFEWSIVDLSFGLEFNEWMNFHFKTLQIKS